jgi:hypothetical protein
MTSLKRPRDEVDAEFIADKRREDSATIRNQFVLHTDVKRIAQPVHAIQMAIQFQQNTVIYMPRQSGATHAIKYTVAQYMRKQPDLKIRIRTYGNADNELYHWNAKNVSVLRGNNLWCYTGGEMVDVEIIDHMRFYSRLLNHISQVQARTVIMLCDHAFNNTHWGHTESDLVYLWPRSFRIKHIYPGRYPYLAFPVFTKRPVLRYIERRHRRRKLLLGQYMIPDLANIVQSLLS